MTTLSPDYFAALASQFAFLSAVMGGFAVTFLGTLLALAPNTRTVSWAIGSAAVSAASFICSALAAAFVTVATHPGAPATVAAGAQSDGPRIALVVTLLLGIYALMLSMGLSGWARSRGVGITTSLIALLGTVLATWLLATT